MIVTVSIRREGKDSEQTVSISQAVTNHNPEFLTLEQATEHAGYQAVGEAVRQAQQEGWYSE